MQRNVWLPVENDLDIFVGQYLVPNFVSNSVSIRLAENEYLLYSPGATLLEAWPPLAALDLKLHILIPNAYHHLGVNVWRNKFPKAKLYTSELALKQLINKQVFSKNNKVYSIADLKAILPQGMDIYEPPGHRAGDVWLIKCKENKSRLWITCDSFLHYERLSNQPVARCMQKFLGAAPGLKMSQVVKWFILDDRKKFKQWVLDRISTDHPNGLIPSHGEPLFSEELAISLSTLIKKRL